MDVVAHRPAPQAQDASPPQAKSLQGAVASTTELPANKVVEQTKEALKATLNFKSIEIRKGNQSSAKSKDGQRETNVQSTLTRTNVTVDNATNSMIFKVLNRSTGEVISQTPSEMILKLRAYSRENAPYPTKETSQIDHSV
ncbi:MAG: flagellar protein FlaG [Cohaesibacteraceae bacterium]|nr:flagellar protein FlaG [Cohaesibacteraceae bacterium]MBL4874935.1 flagellar protein FlaG [Cohaesibacteraceae bacterium]